MTNLTQANLKDMSNAIRALSMDAVQRANSGHPGMPMGMADVASVLYSKFLKFDAKNPEWADRDRFVLSGGHGSMLLYAVNYLAGYEKITLEEIKNFRQMGALTAGHPEVEQDAGIETTTGPLGQGLATAVGMALSERIINARYGDDLMSHYTYTMCGDGDLMEGISHEACSLAGHLNLDRLIVLYDDNNICIDGHTDLTFIDDTPKRFEAYGWDVQEIDGHDYDAIEGAIAKAKTTNTPSLICCKTKIGFGAPTKEGSNSAHGAPLGAEEIKGARENLGWPHGEFEIPADILALWRGVGAQNSAKRESWEARLNASSEKDSFNALLSGDVNIAPIIQELKASFAADKPKKATRQTSGMVLEKLVAASSALIGGSADLTGSNNTKVAASKVIDKSDYSGNYINYGVREHAMGAIMNGLSLHSGLVPYAGTFMQFADYSRPAIRLAALMQTRVIHVLTHDSIGLGEDGPTHQPVEHLSALRAIPNTYVYRPCDGVETAECWELALANKTAPALFALTRQGLPTLRGGGAENLSAKGAYILKETGGEPEITLFATGSEVEIALEAYEHFAKGGKQVRLVSCPCLDLFWEQDGDYIQNLLCNKSIKVAVEAGIRQSWDRVIGGHSIFIGMNSFGASAPAGELYKHFGITPEAIIERVEKKLESKENMGRFSKTIIILLLCIFAVFSIKPNILSTLIDDSSFIKISKFLGYDNIIAVDTDDYTNTDIQVLYQEDQNLEDVYEDKPRITKVTRILETKNAMTLSVEYDYPVEIDGSLTMGVYPNMPHWSVSYNKVMIGKNIATVKISLSKNVPEDKKIIASDTLRLEISHARDNKFIGYIFNYNIPYSKTWVK